MAGTPGPRQTPVSVLTAIKFGTTGQWCSIQIYLGNIGFGADFDVTLVVGLDHLHQHMGTNGEPEDSFFVPDDGPVLPAEQYNRKTTVGNLTVQNFGVSGFNAGDAHNGVIWYFKILKPKVSHFTLKSFTTAGAHSEPHAAIIDNRDMTFPWSFGEPRRELAGETFLGHTGNANFRFNITKGSEEITADENP